MICSICGNDFNRGLVCPFCGNEMSKKKKKKKRRKKIVRVNIKDDMPRVNEAKRRITDLIYKHYESDTRVLKIIHGYGSTGKGGTIKRVTHENLFTYRGRGFIKYFVEGENFSNHSKYGRDLVKKIPELKNDKDFNRNNMGVTLVLF